jgi:hypothetical protein
VIPKPLKKNFLVRSFKNLYFQTTIRPTTKNDPQPNDEEEKVENKGVREVKFLEIQP